MEKDPVIIIGAGPAGLAAAIELGKKNVPVIVFDQWKEGQINEQGQTKLCGGGLVRRAISKLGKLPKSCLPHTKVTTKMVTTTNFVFSQPPVITIDREELAKNLAEKAVSLGVKINYSTKILKIDFQKKEIETRKGNFKYSSLIGADGFFSIVRRELVSAGLLSRRTKYAETVEYCIKPIARDLTFDFDRRFGIGYAWIFPIPNKCVIGAGDSHETKRKNSLRQELLDWASENKLEVDRKTLRGWCIPYDYQGYSFPDNIFLAGDAAGLAGPVSGEGISPAIISGSEIAKKIIDPNYDMTELNQLLRLRKKEYSLLQAGIAMPFIKSPIIRLVAFLLRNRITVNRITFNLFKKTYSPSSKISQKATLMQ
ncbi:MAG TPA: NAD(P)/FAD-dependent oxidoreductase [bacterium]|nr:NAD(P)/FAD-dependent oxidoreductase [bacterium]